MSKLDMLGISPRNAVQRVLLLLAMVLGLIAPVLLSTVSIRSWNEDRRIGYRSYRHMPLGEVIADLEASGVIPAGTSWASEDLKQASVSTSLLWPSSTEALSAVATAAGVDISYPAGGHHAFLVGAVRIERPTSHPPGLRPDWRRRKEDSH